MFAIVDIAGFQEKAEKGMRLQVPSLAAQPGDTMKFDKVFLLSDGSVTTVGKPYVAGASVTVKVLMHGRGDKIIVTKFKRRKRFHKTYRGHRQDFTNIEVMDITK